MISALAAVITLLLGAALLAGGAILALTGEHEDIDWIKAVGIAICGFFGACLCLTAIKAVGLF